MWKKRRYSVPLHPRITAVIRSNYMEKHSIKRPKYQCMNTKENVIVSVDVNRSNLLCFRPQPPKPFGHGLK